MATETLKKKALAIILAIRDIEGADIKGISPDQEALRQHEFCSEYNDQQFLEAAQEAERQGWVRVNSALGHPVVSVTILEAGQQFLDDLAV